MKPPYKILLYVLGVLFFGSLLSAPLYWGAQELAKAAEAKGGIWYEREKKDETRPGWETKGWLGVPLFSAADLILPIAAEYGWPPKKEFIEGETRDERKAREKSAPKLIRAAKKYADFAEDRGWLRSLAEPAQWEAKGFWSFLAADFTKVSNRAIVIAAIFLLWPLLRSLKIRSLQEVGLRKNPHRWKDYLVAWSTSVLMMLGLGLILLKMGVYRMQDNPPWGELGMIFAAGVLVATLEEWIFRAAILGSFRKCMSDYRALLIVSALFSILHFLQSPAKDLGEIHWLSGFAVLPQRFAKFSDPLQLIGGFLTLFAFGWVCGWAVIRTRGLALSMGFHAGLVLGKMGFNRVTNRPKDMRDLLPWLGEDIAVGLVGIGLIVLIGTVLWIYVRFLRGKAAA